MPKADLDALEKWAEWFDAKEPTGHAAKNFRAAIAELRCARNWIEAQRIVEREQPTDDCCDECDVHMKRLHDARSAYDALGPAKETETKG